MEPTAFPSLSAGKASQPILLSEHWRPGLGLGGGLVWRMGEGPWTGSEGLLPASGTLTRDAHGEFRPIPQGSTYSQLCAHDPLPLGRLLSPPRPSGSALFATPGHSTPARPSLNLNMPLNRKLHWTSTVRNFSGTLPSRVCIVLKARHGGFGPSHCWSQNVSYNKQVHLKQM